MRNRISIAGIVLVLSFLVSGVFGAPPVLEVSPTHLEFIAYEGDVNPASQIISIWKAGGDGALRWEVTEGCNWLVVEPTSGKSTGEVDNVNIIVDISGLAAGTYNCQLTVTGARADNSPQSVDVNLVIYRSVIWLSAAVLEFRATEGGANPGDQILTISNSGTGTLDWQVSEDCNWLSVEPNNGSSTGEADDVIISVDITELEADIYDCNLTISDSKAANSPQGVRVILYIRTGDGKLYVPTVYSTIQDAMDTAWAGDTVIVESGTHRGEGNRDLDFKGKAITVRSENGPEDCIIDCNGTEADPHRAFKFHSGEGPYSVVSGLTIVNGYGQRDMGAQQRSAGGAIFIDGSGPTIINCILTGNSAEYFGGGVACTYYSDPTLEHCMISDNSSGNRGGGVYCFYYCNPTVTNCTFTGNSSPLGGGGMYTESSCSPTVKGCVFRGNSGSGGMSLGTGGGTISNCIFSGNFSGNVDEGRGGGISASGSSAVVANCIFSGNSAGLYGGGMHFNYYSSNSLRNCTFVGNSAPEGNALACYSRNYPSNIHASNCVFWDGGNEIFIGDGSTVNITYSDVQGGWSGLHNIDTDPCFVSGPWGDYYLSQMAAGQAVDSPCVDAGSNTAAALGMNIFTTRTDAGGDTGTADIGYHYPIPNPADINGDGVVNFLDFAILGSDWMTEFWLSGDIAPPGGDGIVNMADFVVVADNWLEGI
ncbi:MAG: right-handed parallel beta-helix repeat-containing protein [Planctomycetota bacterium]|nr:MAG: right-handed parallel beta-helix repeat-containing protein [Planctomycetota bacterium]